MTKLPRDPEQQKLLNIIANAIGSSVMNTHAAVAVMRALDDAGYCVVLGITVNLAVNQNFAEDEFGCDYCRNDGKLSSNGVCPKCDAQY